MGVCKPLLILLELRERGSVLATDDNIKSLFCSTPKSKI
jgi:hypothetical protein